MTTQTVRASVALILAVAISVTCIRVGLAIHACYQGRSLLDKAEVEKAASRFEKALFYEPSLATGHLGLALASDALGNRGECRNRFALAYGCDLRLAEAGFRGSNEGLLVNGMWNAAVRILLKEGRDCGSVPYIHLADTDEAYNIGRAFGNFGRSDLALPYLRQTVKSSPNNAEYLYRLGIARKKTGDLTGALSCFERAAKIGPDNPGVLFKKAEAEAALSKYDEARKDYERVTQLVPERPFPWMRLGEVLERLSDKEDAAICFRKAIETAPDYLDAYIALVRTEAFESVENLVSQFLKSVQPVNPLVFEGFPQYQMVGFTVHFPKEVYEHFYCTTVWRLSGEARSVPDFKYGKEVTTIHVEGQMFVMHKKNLLPNGGLESETPQVGLPAWAEERLDVVAPMNVHRIARGGSRQEGMIFIADNKSVERYSGCDSQPIEVTPAEPYLLMGKVGSTGGNGCFGIAWFNKGNRRLNYKWVAKNVRTFSEGGFFFDISYPPPGSSFCRLWLLNVEGPGSVYFDDIALLALEGSIR